MLEKFLVHCFLNYHLFMQHNQKFLGLLAGHLLHLVGKASEAKFLL